MLAGSKSGVDFIHVAVASPGLQILPEVFSCLRAQSSPPTPLPHMDSLQGGMNPQPPAHIIVSRGCLVWDQSIGGGALIKRWSDREKKESRETVQSLGFFSSRESPERRVCQFLRVLSSVGGFPYPASYCTGFLEGFGKLCGPGKYSAPASLWCIMSTM